MDDDPIFHYSRERRLRSAGEAVRRLNSETNLKKPNLFKTLTATKPLAFLFLAVIMLALTAVVMSLMLPKEDEGTLLGNRVTLSAFRFQGSTYVVLTKAAAGESAYIGTVGIAAATIEGGAWEQEVVFSRDGREEFRFALPMDAPQILFVLRAEGESEYLTVRPK